jgi:hypothetical protein
LFCYDGLNYAGLTNARILPLCCPTGCGCKEGRKSLGNSPLKKRIFLSSGGTAGLRPPSTVGRKEGMGKSRGKITLMLQFVPFSMILERVGKMYAAIAANILVIPQ